MYLGSFLFGLALFALCLPRTGGLAGRQGAVAQPSRPSHSTSKHTSLRRTNTNPSQRRHSLIASCALQHNCDTQTNCRPSPQSDITHHCRTRARTRLKHGYYAVIIEKAGRPLFCDSLRASFFFNTISSTCELLFLSHCTLLASVRIDHGAGADAGERL